MIPIAQASNAYVKDWSVLRHQLWSDNSAEEHELECKQILSTPLKFVAFIAINDNATADGAARVVAFTEASLRYDCVNSCDKSPVAFLEGIYVVKDFRRHGIAGRLVEALQKWGIDKGCSELASDALLENDESHAMHKALGFMEVERVVVFHKRLFSTSGKN